MMETDVTSLKKKWRQSDAEDGQIVQIRRPGFLPEMSLIKALPKASHLTWLHLRFSFFSHLPSTRNAVTINKSAYKSALRSQEKDHVNTRYDYSDYMEVSSRFLCKL